MLLTCFSQIYWKVRLLNSVFGQVKTSQQKIEWSFSNITSMLFRTNVGRGQTLNLISLVGQTCL